MSDGDTRPRSDPAADPPLTIRCESWEHRHDLSARRAIRIHHEIEVFPWVLITGNGSTAGGWLAHDEVTDWHIVSGGLDTRAPAVPEAVEPPASAFDAARDVARLWAPYMPTMERPVATALVEALDLLVTALSTDAEETRTDG